MHQPIPFGDRERLLRGPKPRHVDVVVPGIDGPARYRLRELRQGEVEDISTAGFKQTVGDDGKVSRTFDSKGNKARYVAYSLIGEDGQPYFQKPSEDWALLNSSLSPSQMDVLYKAVMELNGLGEEARKEVGKASGPTGESRA